MPTSKWRNFRKPDDGYARISDAAARIGVIDIGSNSVRLVVFDGATRSPAYFFNEKVLCGLGSDLEATRRLSPEGRGRALAAIRRFVALADRMNLTVLDGVATAAMRDAEDGLEFRDQIERETGLPVRIASGADEARLSAQGVLLGGSGADGLVADLGGASLELIDIAGGAVGAGVTKPLGPLRLAALELSGEEAVARIDAVLAECPNCAQGRGRTLHAVGGAWRAFAKLHMARGKYPLQVLHDYEMSADVAVKAARWIADSDPADLRKFTDTSPSRLAVTPLAARVLERVVIAVQPSSVLISSFGLREGVLYEHLPAHLRAQDPLLQACAAQEARRARFPGFGAELAEWIAPLFPGLDAPTARLMRAACLMNDISWRTHPDYRAASSFEAVARANLGGVDHPGRIFIGIALLYCYKGGRKAAPMEKALALIDDERGAQAETAGRAIRLGAMLSGSTPGVLALCPVGLEGGLTTLTLDPSASALKGEAVERRLHSLAHSMGREAALR